MLASSLSFSVFSFAFIFLEIKFSCVILFVSSSWSCVNRELHNFH